MGEMGKGLVQNGRCEVAQDKVQVQSGFILSLEMGATIRKKIKFLLCDHQQEEPDELRGSRPVPWEGGGAIPLPDPIGGNRPAQNDEENLKNKTKKTIYDN